MRSFTLPSILALQNDNWMASFSLTSGLFFSSSSAIGFASLRFFTVHVSSRIRGRLSALTRLVLVIAIRGDTVEAEGATPLVKLIQVKLPPRRRTGVGVDKDPMVDIVVARVANAPIDRTHAQVVRNPDRQPIVKMHVDIVELWMAAYYSPPGRITWLYEFGLSQGKDSESQDKEQRNSLHDGFKWHGGSCSVFNARGLIRAFIYWSRDLEQAVGKALDLPNEILGGSMRQKLFLNDAKERRVQERKLLLGFERIIQSRLALIVGSDTTLMVYWLHTQPSLIR